MSTGSRCRNALNIPPLPIGPCATTPVAAGPSSVLVGQISNLSIVGVGFHPDPPCRRVRNLPTFLVGRTCVPQAGFQSANRRGLLPISCIHDGRSELPSAKWVAVRIGLIWQRIMVGQASRLARAVTAETAVLPSEAIQPTNIPGGADRQSASHEHGGAEPAPSTPLRASSVYPACPACPVHPERRPVESKGAKR